MILKPIFFKL